MRKEKTLLLDEIQEKIDGAKAMIIASFDKLEPNTSWAFRNLLGQSGTQFEVVKKRVFMKAAEKSGVKVDDALLKGHIGVVFIQQDDAMAPAKAMFKFSEENGNLLQVICGQIEGKIMPGSELEELSKLPGIDEMRATLLGLFTSPMSQTLAVIEAALAGPLSIIEKKSES
ncbi:MAG: 50S ribosomal protein L10 [Verrucomicrobia bacterium]|nr:50S ribosomal protein L10 [Verrucomicrobiota bacterium]MBU6446556.1 50S ribosomal protein L10 [Verrucomicrobiota bacterium]